MARNVEDVIDAADDPEIAVLISPRSVAGEIAALDFAPVLLLVTSVVAVNRPQHCWPRFADDELAALIRADLFALIVDHRGIDAKKGKGSRSGFERRGAGQRSDHLHAGFGLPPGIDDRAALAADVLVIPDPRFGIDRLANRAEQAKGRKVMFRRPVRLPIS